MTAPQMIAKARRTFSVIVPDDSIELIYLNLRFAVEAKYYPVFTLLGQFFGIFYYQIFNFLEYFRNYFFSGGGILAIEALLKSGTPEIFCDSMGYPLSIPVFKLIGESPKVTAYVHYPFIRY